MTLTRRMQDMLKALHKGRKAHQTLSGLWVVPGRDITGYNSRTMFRLMFNGLADWTNDQFRFAKLTVRGEALAKELHALRGLP